MMKKAYLAMACVLLAPMLLISVSSSASYDPWVDLDDNGTINIFDVVTLAGSYQTAGDPTKNVTIAERANTLAFTLADQSVAAGGQYQSPWIPVDGYSKVTICLYNNAAANYYRLETRHAGGIEFFADRATNFGTDLVRTYDVPNEEILVHFENDGVSQTTLFLDVYLIP